MDERTKFDREQREFEDLANEALDEACAYIQRKIGVETGDFASMFFSDGIVLNIFKKYINEEVYLNILTKNQLIQKLIENDIKDDPNGDFIGQVLRNGFIGYENKTLEQLRADWFQRLENQ
jgi:hypothetical protein